MKRTSFFRRPSAWLAALAVVGACTAGVDKIMGPSLNPEGPSKNILPAGTSVVISQVYGGGGNSGATLKNDFIELYNNGSTTVDLSTWSVQYASSTGTSWQVTNLTGSVAPGQYYLVQEAAGAGGTANLPTPDATGSINMSGTSGKVALLNVQTALGGSAAGASPLGGATCPNNASAANIVDFVGFGTASTCFEGTGTTATLTNTTAALRAGNGATNTNDNKSDFASGAANPRNTASSAPATPVATVSPSTPSVAIGATTNFTTSATLNGGSLAITSTVWSSSNTGVATIDPTTGVATALTGGNTTITATSQTASGQVVGTTTLTVASALAPQAPGLVISQVYGGGGNSGATYKNDFIELYNGGTTTVDLTGWAVQYASSTQANWQRTPLSGTIAPGHYYLIQEGAGAAGTTNLPTPDLLAGVDSIALGATAGKVALTRMTSLLSGNCPSTDPSLADFVGYGAANCFEGSAPTAVLTNTTSAQRADGGRQDTDNNSADFTVANAAPRNSASPALTPLGILSATISPANTAVLVGSPVNFTVTAQQFGHSVAINSAAWTSSNTAVATINPTTGAATTVATGTTTIGVTLSTANGPVSASTVLTVSTAAASVTLSPATWTLKSGSTVTFVPSALDASNNPTSTTYTWASSNPLVATVDANGVATGVGGGTTTITATSANNVVGSAQLIVTVGNVSIQVRTDPPVPLAMQTQLFINSGSTDAHGAAVNGGNVTWTSANPSIASIDPASGVVTAHTVGTVLITATANTDNQSSGTLLLPTINATISPTARVGHNTDLGTPTGADPNNDVRIARRNYTLSYNPAHGGPNWVSWNLDASHKGGSPRCNCFSQDTTLTKLGIKAYDTNDWINGGIWSRGHMSPSADWADTDGDNAPTFFLSNMIPQNQTANAGAWGDFENALRVFASGSTEIYIIAGPIFTPNRTPGVDGFGFMAGTGHIAVPDSMWKVAVIVPDARAASGITQPSDVQVIAVNMENSAVSVGAYTGYLTTIDKIQQSTHLDLLSALPEAIQCKLEVRNCAPQAVISGAGLAGGNEGQALSFSGSTSTDADNDPLTYSWQVNGVAAGSGASLNQTFASFGTYVVKLTVNDGKGGSSSATANVVIQDVAPTVGALPSAANLIRFNSYSGAGTFTDPGADTWTATVDYGDGSGVMPLALSGQTFQLQHQYTKEGTFTITVVVSDGGGSSSSTTQVTPLSPRPATGVLSGLVGSLPMRTGEINALQNDVTLTLNSLLRGNATQALSELDSFITLLNTDVSRGLITPAAAAQALLCAQQIQTDVRGTYGLTSPGA